MCESKSHYVGSTRTKRLLSAPPNDQRKTLLMCQRAAQRPHPDHLTLIHRQVSFELAAFDRLKDWQRHYERTEGRTITNSEVMCRLILNNAAP